MTMREVEHKSSSSSEGRRNKGHGRSVRKNKSMKTRTTTASIAQQRRVLLITYRKIPAITVYVSTSRI